MERSIGGFFAGRHVHKSSAELDGSGPDVADQAEHIFETRRIHRKRKITDMNDFIQKRGSLEKWDKTLYHGGAPGTLAHLPNRTVHSWT
jgi:hypothetical protein